MITRAAVGRCANGESSRASRGVESSRVNDWCALAGWSSGHSRGSIASAGSRCAMSGAQTSMRRSCPLDVPLSVGECSWLVIAQQLVTVVYERSLLPGRWSGGRGGAGAAGEAKMLS